MSKRSPKKVRPLSVISGFNADKPLRLRGHHLLCILTYIGEGYTPEFVANFDALSAHINQTIKARRRVRIEIIGGADDICAALRHQGKATCAHAAVCSGTALKFRDAVALKDVARVLQMPSLRPGSILEIGVGEIRYLRRYFLSKTIRRACALCQWHGLCSRIAADRYAGVKLLPHAQP